MNPQERSIDKASQEMLGRMTEAGLAVLPEYLRSIG